MVPVAGPAANDLIDACTQIGLEAMRPGLDVVAAMRAAMEEVLFDLRLITH